MEGRDGELGNSQEASIVGYGTDYDEGALGGGHFFAGPAAGEHG